MNKLSVALLLSASLVSSMAFSAPKTDILSIPDARKLAEKTQSELQKIEDVFMYYVENDAAPYHIRKDIVNPTTQLINTWPKGFLNDNDGRYEFSSCRSMALNFKSAVRTMLNPIYKEPHKAQESIKQAFIEYQNDKTTCQAILQKTDNELAEVMEKRRSDKCEKPTVIYDVKSGEMVEQPKPDYCNK